MRVYHDDLGKVLYTWAGVEERAPKGPYVESDLEPKDLRDLSDWLVVGGAVVQSSIDGERAIALSYINERVGRERSAYVTLIPMQETVYAAKEAEATAWIAEATPPIDMARYPFIEAEIGITAPDADSVAQVFLNLAYQWRMVGVRLERIRLDYVGQVERAFTAAEISAARAAFEAEFIQ